MKTTARFNPCQRPIILIITWLLTTCFLSAEVSLGPIGGKFEPQSGSNYLKVTHMTNGAPGDQAGLLVGDFIYAAFGKDFGVLSTDTKKGWKGSVQDFGDAINRAEAGNGTLPLSVLRSGVGTVDLDIQLSAVGGFGPAYPLGSTKFDAMYQWSCEQIHSKTMASSTGNFGQNTGLFGIILLAHPNWDDSTSAKPYRLSINKLRDASIAFLESRILSPVEEINMDGTPNDGSVNDSDPNDQNWEHPGSLENWQITTSVMFLAEYRKKTNDQSVTDATLQRGADILANRVQTYDHPPGVINGPVGPPAAERNGMMGHRGVGGDYSHSWWSGLNIINSQTIVALAMLKGTTASIDDGKFQACWDFMRRGTNTGGGEEDGNICYAFFQTGGYDASARTAGAVFGLSLYGGLSAADEALVVKQKAYITRQWQRMQHAHAYTVGGAYLYQFALPYLSDRQQRHIMENLEYFYQFHRNPSGTLEYFGGRGNNGGDSYLNFDNVKLINVAMAQAIHSGNLPSFPVINPDRIHADFKAPVLAWPSLDARTVTINTSTSDFNVDITDYQGTVLNAGDYTATWSHLSGPGTATFSSTVDGITTATFPSNGTYRIQLEVTKGTYTLTEPIDVFVFDHPPAGYITGNVNYQVYKNITGVDVSDLTSHHNYPDAPDISKTISKLEGTYSGNDYGSRIQGYIIPQVSGDYTFYIASDDASEFKFGADEASASKICEVTTWATQYEWTKLPSQTSSVQTLTAGTPYFFEVNHKEAASADHVAVAWTGPGISAPTVISGGYLALHVGDSLTLTKHPINQSAAAGDDLTLSVEVTGEGPFLYEWTLDGVSYWDVTANPTLTLTNISAGVAGDYRCKITSPTGTITSDLATLTVTGVGDTVAGGLWREVYEDIGGMLVSDLSTHEKYSKFPDFGGVITSSEAPSEIGSNYGQRWTGWLIPDTTGAHVFYITSDDSSEIWLSTDDHEYNKVKIAAKNGYTSVKKWSSGGQSVAIDLVSGVRYYIEVRHKEGTGGDHCAVTWQRPGDPVPTDGVGSIPSQNLEYKVGGEHFTSQNIELALINPTTSNVRIRPGVGLDLDVLATPAPNQDDSILWTMESGTGTVTFESPNSLSTGATFSAEGDYLLRCTVDNANFFGTAEVNVTVTEDQTTDNYGVVVDAGTNGSLDVAAVFNLSPTVTDDAKPIIPGAITTTWVQISGPGAATFGDASASSTTVSFNYVGQYIFRLYATDGEVTTYDDVTIDVTSPVTVDVVTTDSSAAEAGPDTGTYTITRDGPTTAALTVNVNMTGTATNGTDYTSIASTIEIPVGSASTTVTLTPLSDLIYEGIETAELTLTAGAYTIGTSPAIVSIDNHPDADGDGLPDDWENTHFGDLTTADGTGDADSDGLNDAAEFAASTDPNLSDTDADGYSDGFEVHMGTDPLDDTSKPNLTTNLAHHWKLDEASGTNVADASVITPVNGATNSSTWNHCQGTGNLSFNGSSERVDLPSTASLLGTGDFGISLWVKNTNTTNGMYYVQQRENTSNGHNGEYVLAQNTNGTVRFFIYNNGYQFDIETTTAVNDGQWHHIMAVRQGENGTIYIDGNIKGQGSGTVKALLPRLVAIGYDRRDTSEYFQGQLDDVRLYNRALVPEDAHLMMTNQAPSPTPSEGTVTMAEDVTTGTIVSTVSVTDPNSSDQHCFSLSAGNDSGIFAIDDTGKITTAGSLDYEAATQHTLTVTVHDNGTPSREQTTTVTINVSDIVTADDSDGDTLDDQWEFTHYGTTEAVAALDDSDADGLTTFQEMVFGGNPVVNDSNVPPVQSRLIDDAGTPKVEFKFRRPKNHANLNITYQIQQGTDMVEGNWVNYTSVTPTFADSGANEWLTYKLPMPDGARVFYRCRVTPNP